MNSGDANERGRTPRAEGEGHEARPNALAEWPDVARALEGRRPAVFLDYDGTLAPIADRPGRAVLSEAMRETLRRLARTWPTAVVSGRGREDVETLVGLPGLNYAGSHGFDISGPEAGGRLRLEVAEELAPVVEEVSAELGDRTRDIPGALVEDKKYSIAVHYRLVDEGRVGEVERAVDEVLTSRPRLRKSTGKKVFELRPAMEWDKGRAVLWLLEALGLDGPEVLPIYIGDDLTDEDAFRALRDVGIGVLVSERPRPTAARYSLREVDEVRELLERLADMGEEARDSEGGRPSAVST